MATLQQITCRAATHSLVPYKHCTPFTPLAIIMYSEENYKYGRHTNISFSVLTRKSCPMILHHTHNIFIFFVLRISDDLYFWKQTTTATKTRYSTCRLLCAYFHNKVYYITGAHILLPAAYTTTTRGCSALPYFMMSFLYSHWDAREARKVNETEKIFCGFFVLALRVFFFSRCVCCWWGLARYVFPKMWRENV